jgi:tol-pal system protein YbgF
MTVAGNMSGRARFAALVVALLASTAPAALAQTADDPTIDGTTGEVIQPAAPKPKPKPAAAVAKPAGKQSAASAEMQSRIDQLEEQLSDMQVVVGTLESLSKGRPRTDASGAAVAVSEEMDNRVRELEVRLQQMSSQLTEMSQQVRQLGAGGGAAPAAVPAKPVQPVQPEPSAAPAAPAPADGEMVAQADGTFGQTTVTREPDPVQQILQDNAPAAGTPDTQLASATQPAAAAPVGPEQAYEAAYGQLLQQNFTGAESSFRDFLAQNPDSPLNSEAQYFLGETHYVRGQYKQAAESYLKGYSTYRQGKRAPDSLLKLAMSLGRLGQKESACNAFTALDGEYPSAPSNVKRRAITERERIGC